MEFTTNYAKSVGAVSLLAMHAEVGSRAGRREGSEYRIQRP